MDDDKTMNRTISHFTHMNKLAQAAVAAVMALVLVLWISNLNAAEMVPTAPADQTPVKEQFKPIGNNQLRQGKLNNQPTQAVKKAKGFLGWLTDFSRKPANFHYIDLIEVLQ